MRQRESKQQPRARPRALYAGRNEEKMKMNVWRDEGDDGVTGWQPIGEPLIRTTRTTEETNR
jgi:hypothetical protein